MIEKPQNVCFALLKYKDQLKAIYLPIWIFSNGLNIKSEHNLYLVIFQL